MTAQVAVQTESDAGKCKIFKFKIFFVPNQAFEKVVEPVKSSTQVLENFYRRSFSCLNCPPLGILYIITWLTLGPSDCNVAK